MRFPVPGNARINPKSALGREMAAEAQRRQAHERAEQERDAAEQARYLEELDAELDREKAEAAEPKPAPDPVQARLDALERSRVPLDPDKIPRWPNGHWIRE